MKDITPLESNKSSGQGMGLEEAAGVLAQLGNPVRLQVVRTLVQAGHGGIPVGRIQEALGIPASTLSHHLNHLKNSGLIRQQRERTTLWCIMNYDLLNEVMAYLMKECCAGFALQAESMKDSANGNHTLELTQEA